MTHAFASQCHDPIADVWREPQHPRMVRVQCQAFEYGCTPQERALWLVEKVWAASAPGWGVVWG